MTTRLSTLHVSKHLGMAAMVAMLLLVIGCGSTSLADRQAKACKAFDGSARIVRDVFSGKAEWVEPLRTDYDVYNQEFLQSSGEVIAGAKEAGVSAEIYELMQDSRKTWQGLAPVIRRDYLSYVGKPERRQLEADVLGHIERVQKQNAKALSWLRANDK